MPTADVLGLKFWLGGWNDENKACPLVAFLYSFCAWTLFSRTLQLAMKALRLPFSDPYRDSAPLNSSKRLCYSWSLIVSLSKWRFLRIRLNDVKYIEKNMFFSFSFQISLAAVGIRSGSSYVIFRGSKNVFKSAPLNAPVSLLTRCQTSPKVSPINQLNACLTWASEFK